MQREIVKVDNLPGKIIYPQNQAFQLDQLVEDFGYPDVDIEKIDFDWDFENI
jgi:hypothetical protein